MYQDILSLSIGLKVVWDIWAFVSWVTPVTIWRGDPTHGTHNVLTLTNRLAAQLYPTSEIYSNGKTWQTHEKCLRAEALTSAPHPYPSYSPSPTLYCHCVNSQRAQGSFSLHVLPVRLSLSLCFSLSLSFFSLSLPAAYTRATDHD